MIRIAVSGYYGCGNTGDEAVLAAILESFQRRAGSAAVEFTVLSANAADTERRHAVRAVDRMNAGIVRRTLRESDLLLSGGGSLLQDTTSVRSLVYYLLVVRAALRARTPVMFYAQGIGPLWRSSSRFMTKVTADRVDCITVRDPASADLLREIGVRTPPIEVTADPAFALTLANCGDEAIYSARKSSRPMLGISVRPWAGGAPASEMARAVKVVCAKLDADPVFIAMQPPGDTALSQEIARHMDGGAAVIAPDSPHEALGLIGSTCGLIGMRLHALIFAASKGIPMLALSYDPKVRQLMRDLGRERFAVDVADFDADRFASLGIEALSGGPAEMAALRTRASEMAERALVNVDRAMETAGRSKRGER